MNRRTVLLLVAACAVGAPLATPSVAGATDRAADAPALAAEPGRRAPVDGRWLAAELTRGGYVLYFRHTRTHRDQIGHEREMLRSGRLALDRCETQRNLDENGLRDAALQADALQRLGWATGPVTASRYCRAWQHARAVTGRVDRWSDPLTPPRDRTKVAELRALLATPPAPGTNAWLFAHGGVLWGAADYDSVESETFVFRPEGDGRTARLVASIRIDEWAALLAWRPCCAPRDYWTGSSTPPE